ncbi:TIGR03943 family putative permease subunit [Clostridium sp. Marseille-QA1073]
MKKMCLMALIFILTISVGGCGTSNQSMPDNYWDKEIADNSIMVDTPSNTYDSDGQSEKNIDRKDSSSENQSRPKADIIIRDNFFLGQLDDMYINLNSYKGKTIQYEGFIYNLVEEENAKQPFAVCRKYFCCGTDAYLVGLPCEFSGDIPDNNLWVVVTGILTEDEEGHSPYLKVTDLSALSEPGNEFIYK